MKSLALVFALSTAVLAQNCSNYDSSRIGATITIANNNHHLTLQHNLVAAAVNTCTYSDTGVANQNCFVDQVLHGFPNPGKHEAGVVSDLGGHRLTDGYPPGTASQPSPSTTNTIIEFAVQGCGLLGCTVGAIFSWPPFIVTAPSLIYSDATPVSAVCVHHSNVPPQGCGTAFCGTPIMADLTPGMYGENIGHLTDRQHGYTFKFRSQTKAETIGWTEPGSWMSVLVRPDPNGDYTVQTSDNIFGNYSRCANGKRCKNGIEALRYYCDDPINSGNGDGVCDSKDLHFKDLRWQVGRTKLLTMQQAGIKSFSLDATVMKGKSRITDEFGNTFAIQSTAAVVTPDKDVQRGMVIWDVIPAQSGMK